MSDSEVYILFTYIHIKLFNPFDQRMTLASEDVITVVRNEQSCISPPFLRPWQYSLGCSNLSLSGLAHNSMNDSLWYESPENLHGHLCKVIVTSRQRSDSK